MKTVIAGGTGFLGRALVPSLARDGRDILILTRQSPPPVGSHGARYITWSPTGSIGSWAAELRDAAAIVNLAGESIAARRWSSGQKRRILDSRLQATRSLVAAVRAAPHPPQVFINASAVGYYGPLGSEIVTEEQTAGSDFLASSTRVACIRTGLVLDKEGGALPQMLLPFKLGGGGPLGSGRQYWPWIHRDDWIALVGWTIDTSAASGALNATAPNPVTNAEFAKALGRVLHRPAFMPAPAFALRLALGEMADALLLSGQRAVPAKAERLGFTFRFSRLEDALQAIFDRR